MIYGMSRASRMVIGAGRTWWRRAAGNGSWRCPAGGSAGLRAGAGIVEGNDPSAGDGGPAMELAVSVTVMMTGGTGARAR